MTAAPEPFAVVVSCGEDPQCLVRVGGVLFVCERQYADEKSAGANGAHEAALRAARAGALREAADEWTLTIQVYRASESDRSVDARPRDEADRFVALRLVDDLRARADAIERGE